MGKITCGNPSRMVQNLYGGTADSLYCRFEIASQPEDVPRHPFTFVDGDATYPKEFGPLGVALGGFKVVMGLRCMQILLDF